MTPNVQECWFSTIGAPSDVPDGSRDSQGDFSTIPSMWLRLNSIILRDVTELPLGKCLIIAYEDLIQHQQTTIKTIFDFLNLKETHANQVEKISKRVFPQVNSSTPGDPLHQWKEELTANETAVIEEALSVSEQYQFIQGHLRAQ